MWSPAVSKPLARTPQAAEPLHTLSYTAQLPFHKANTSVCHGVLRSLSCRIPAPAASMSTLFPPHKALHSLVTSAGLPLCTTPPHRPPCPYLLIVGTACSKDAPRSVTVYMPSCSRAHIPIAGCHFQPLRVGGMAATARANAYTHRPCYPHTVACCLSTISLLHNRFTLSLALKCSDVLPYNDRNRPEENV